MRSFVLAAGFVIFFCTHALYAQLPDTVWTKTFGGASDDCGYSVQQTTDEGYIVAGNTYSHGVGESDVYLIKTDSSGDTLWTKTFGGFSYDTGYFVQQTTDGGYIIAGETYLYGAGNYDAYLIKTDSSGDTLWTNTIGGVEDDCGYSVQQTTDGGYIVAGYTASYGAGSYDVYLIKTDFNGDTEWTKTIGGASTDFGYSVCQTIDGGYIVAGNTYSHGVGESDVYLIKTDSSGDTLWTKTFGGFSYDTGYFVQQTTDGGYIISGDTYSYGAGNYDAYLIKTDSSGDTLWTKTIGGDQNDYGRSVQQTTDGGYIVAGYTASYGTGSYDVYLIKTDFNGDTEWTKTIGGASTDFGYSVCQTIDGGYIVAGNTYSHGVGESDVYLIKTDSSGDTLWTKTFGGFSYDTGYFVQQTTDGGYIISGDTYSYGAGNYDAYLIKTDSSGDTLWTKTIGGDQNDYGRSVQQTTDDGYIVAGNTRSYGAGWSDVYLIKLEFETGIEEETEENLLFSLESVGPNPFSSNLSITCSIPEQARIELAVFDLSGRLVEELISDQLPAGSHTAIWRPSQNIPDGCYFVILNVCGHHEVWKCLKLN